MPRPHEDLERHVLVDHRTGGEPVFFTQGSWIAIEIGHVKASRVDAALAAYESMLERWRAANDRHRVAAVLSAANERAVIALCELGGHDDFRRLASAWDEHHRLAAGHAVVESRSLALYQVAESFGDLSLDPSSRDAYVLARVYPLGTGAAVDPRMLQAAGFESAVVFRSTDANRQAIIYRFESFDSYNAVRDEPPVSVDHVHVDKTFPGA